MEFAKKEKESEIVNNDYYHGLGERWYRSHDDPIALLRCEANLRNPWIAGRIHEFYSYRPGTVKILDVGCGGGILSNDLAKEGFDVTAIDLSASSLEVAKRRDESRSVKYLQADAYDLPFDEGSFDVVTSTDFLEHVTEPQKVIREVSRVLAPSGFFFFHTFNKNWLSRLMIIKSFEWFMKKNPEHLYVYDFFIKPKDMRKWLESEHLDVLEMHGMRPRILQAPIFRLLAKGEVDPRFRFKWTSSLAISYIGIARKGGQADF